MADGKKLESSPQSSSPPSSYIAAVLGGGLGNLRLEEKKRDDFGQENKGFEEGNADSEEEQRGGRFQYPLIPTMPDCSYYLKTGYCGYGLYCKYNHPQVVKEHPESVGLIECKFYSMTGGCRFGNTCKYRHYRDKTEMAQVELNNLGLPLRPGETGCSYYMRNGYCKYSTYCKFHHPEPIAVAGGGLLPGYPNLGSLQGPASGASPRPSFLTTGELVSFFDASRCSMPAMLSPRQSLQPNPDWNGFQVPEANSSSPSEGNVQHPSDSTLNSPTTMTEDSMHQFINHLSEASDLSPVRLPLRPDQPICMYYKRFGICKYGPSCESDHPMYRALFPVVEAAESFAAEISSIRTEEVKTKGHNALVQQSA